MAIHKIKRASAIDAIKKTSTLADGGGLYLTARDGRDGLRKTWLFKKMVGGALHQRTLGTYPALSLKDARSEAEALRDCLARHGSLTDPDQIRMTFGEYAEEWLNDNGLKAYSAGGKKWHGNIRNHCQPIVDKMIDEIDIKDIKDMLAEKWTSAPWAARKTQRQIARIFAGAKTLGLTKTNPARWRDGLDALLKAKAPRTKHHPFVPVDRLPAIYRSLEKGRGDGLASAAVRMQILTAARSVEIRYMKWSEVSMRARTWTVPGDKMKNEEDHVVYLSQPAMDILAEARRKAGPGARLVFPSSHSADGTVSRKTMAAFFKRRLPEELADKTLHGTARGTFSTWANNSARFRPDVIEAALSHEDTNGVRASYNHADYVSERRQLAEEWAAHVTSAPDASVIALHA